MVEAYPLTWPEGWPRTEPRNRERARFSRKDHASTYGARRPVTFEGAAKELYAELDRLGARNTVLSSNLKLRNDKIPYSTQERGIDPGVAVYFLKDGKEQCIPCDKWDRAEDNIKGIAKTIDALRGIERWGAKSMVDAAFRGFTALPAPDQVISRTPREIIGVPADMMDLEYIEFKYKQKAKELHPDNGGTKEAFQELNTAWQDLKRELGG